MAVNVQFEYRHTVRAEACNKWAHTPTRSCRVGALTHRVHEAKRRGSSAGRKLKMAQQPDRQQMVQRAYGQVVMALGLK